MHAGGHRGLARLVHKDVHQHPPAEQIQRDNRQAEHPHEFQPGLEAAAHALHLARADVLRREVGYAVAQRRQRGNHEVVELDGGGVARHHARAERIDNALDDDIAHRNEALLQDARHGNRRDAAKQREGEQRAFLVRLHAPQAAQHKEHRQHTAHALAEERRPRHARNAHLKRGDKQDIHEDVARRGRGQEDKRRFGIAQRGEDARRHVVKEHERQPEDVDIQIELGIRKHVFRRVDEPQQTVAAQRAREHQRRADDRA